MPTLKKGDQVLAKRPGKRSMFRRAKVEQVATKGVDAAVQVKFIGDSSTFLIRWEHIKQSKVTTNDSLARKNQPNTPSNPIHPKEQCLPATVVDLTADDGLEQVPKAEEKEQELTDQKPLQSTWSGNKTDDTLQHPYSLDSQHALSTIPKHQPNFASSGSSHMKFEPWVGERSKEPVIDTYIPQNPIIQYNNHRDELPSTFRWRRNETTNWRYSDYMRHEYTDERPKFRWETYEPQRPSESSLLPPENQSFPASSTFREHGFRREYDSQVDPITEYNDYGRPETKEDRHRKDRPTGGTFEYLPKTDPEVYTPQLEQRSRNTMNNRDFPSESTHPHREPSSRRVVLPDPFTNTTTQKRKDIRFEWNTVSHPPPNPQVLGSESDTDTRSPLRDEQDGKKRSLRRNESHRPVRKKSRAESELRKNTIQKQPDASSSHIDLPDEPRHHSVNLDDIPIPRMGSVQKQTEPERNIIQSQSEQPPPAIERFVEDEFTLDPYTSTDLDLQSGSPRTLGEERCPGETILATGISAGPLVAEQIPNGSCEQKPTHISACDDPIAPSFQPQRRFPFSADVSENSDDDLMLTEACREYSGDDSLNTFNKRIDKGPVTSNHTVKPKKRRKGIPKSMKKVRKVSTQLQNGSHHSEAILHAISDSKDLTADWSYMNSDKTSSNLMVFGCVCDEGGLRDCQQNRSNELVQCGLCGLWSHLCCTKLSSEELASFRSHSITKSTHFICAACVGNIISEELDTISLSNSKTLRTMPFRLLVGYRETADEGDRERVGSDRTSITSILDRFDDMNVSERAENVEVLRTGVITSSVGTELTACSRKFTRWNSKCSS